MNNNTQPSSKRRCKCGRYISLGEDIAGIGIFGYECPTCFHQKYATPLTSDEYYNKFKIVLK